MRHGCIAIGDIRCDGCGRIIPHPERYLLIEEKDGVEVEGGEKKHYCVECSLNKGYARYTEERGQKEVLTFFPEKT